MSPSGRNSNAYMSCSCPEISNDGCEVDEEEDADADDDDIESAGPSSTNRVSNGPSSDSTCSSSRVFSIDLESR